MANKWTIQTKSISETKEPPSKSVFRISYTRRAVSNTSPFSQHNNVGTQHLERSDKGSWVEHSEFILSENNSRQEEQTQLEHCQHVWQIKTHEEHLMFVDTVRR